MTRFKFTDKALEALTLVDVDRLKVWDTGLKGLGAVLGPKGLMFVVNSKHKDGKWHQENIGTRAQLTLPEARKRATEILGNVAGGQATPGDKRRISSKSITLRAAVALKVQSMKQRKRRPQAIASLQDELLGPHMTAWLDRPIRTITAPEWRAHHLKIAETSKHSANRIAGNFRTVWNHIAVEAALAGEEVWPQSPTLAILWFRKSEEGYQRRRAEPLMWSALPAWYEEITKARRLLFNMLTLLTGLRANCVMTLRWDLMNLTTEPQNIRIWNVAKGTWKLHELPPMFAYLPSPKGGPRKAFRIPLPQYLVAMLQKEKERLTCPWLSPLVAARFPPTATPRDKDNGWVFPGVKVKSRPCTYCEETGQGPHVSGIATHIVDSRRSSKSNVGIPSPHRLRDTYLNATPEIGMPEPICKALVNHTEGDVTERYRNLNMNPDTLREWQEKQCEFLLAAIRGERRRHLTLVA